MRVTFLGTGTSQGIPVIACDCEVCQSTDPLDKRTRSSIMVETDGNVFVVDSGPDFRQQMLRENVKNIDAIIYTHEHKDHTAGLDDVRAFNFILKKEIEIYGPQRVLDALKQQYPYIYDNPDYPGLPKININKIENKEFVINGTLIIPIEVLHYKLPVLGFRFGDFSYITDANFIAEDEKEKIKGSKVIVLNALRKKEHISHFTLQEAVDLMNELNPEEGYLIHMSHQIGTHQEIENELPDNIHLSYDGLQVKL
ncbi:MAG: hypothetical protein COC01_05690 [Bacteroidetes bacterium]|nr:MAG: hypothetical protein COC01_05690 [Bacteroidota bacterium]